MENKTKDSTEGKLRYVTEDGKPVAVLVDLKTFESISNRMEELEDSLELKHAIDNAEGFISLEELKKGNNVLEDE